MMNIIKENIDELNAVLKVKVTPDDYQVKYDSALKDIQKKANMPGFRPGKVPAGLVKKIYGKSVLADEINKLLNDSIYQYISENKIEALGSPLPKEDNRTKIDWENQKEFEFAYELGLAPKIMLSISSKEKFTYFVIKVDEVLIDEYVLNLRKRFGNVDIGEISETTDLLNGDFVELDKEGNIAAGGIFKTTSVFLESVKDDNLKKLFIGLKAEDKVKLPAEQLKPEAEYISQLIGGDVEKVSSTDFQFTLKNITRMTPANINQDLFNKIYGEGKVTTEEEFRNKIKEELQKKFSGDSDHRFMNDVQKALLEKANISLPDAFLKKYLYAVNERKATMEQVSEEYAHYSNHLKWQLIENKILKENKIVVSNEEAMEDVKSLVKSQFAKYGKAGASDDEIKLVAEKILAEEEPAKKLYDKLYQDKMKDFFKTTFTLTNKEVSQEEFFKQ